MRRPAALWVTILVTCGFLSASVNRVAAATSHVPSVGINITWSTNIDWDIAAYSLTGAQWIRFDAFWSVIEPVKNPDTTTWSWTKLDDEVQTAEAHGLKVLLMPDYAPKWAQARKPRCISTRCAPKNPADYAHFVAAVAHRYHEGGSAHTHVHSYEIWNEPNGPGFSPGPDPHKYVEMLKLSYQAIQSIDPGADVITGGLSASPTKIDRKTHRVPTYSSTDFLTAMYKAGARASFTAVATHPYSEKKSPLFEATWNAFYNTPKLYAIMKHHHDAKKKIWGTETGYSSSDAFGVGLDKQAAYLQEAVVDWFGWPFAGPLFTYNWRDTDDLGTGKFDTSGLVNFDGTAKPALAAFIAAATGLTAKK
jgi:polysaccharide biosynthesis protein PslG